MSACLQRFQWRSQRANLPALHEPGRPDRKGMGRAGRCCRPPGQRRQARRAAWPARPAARARPLAGVVPAGRRAAARPPGPPARHPRQGHGRLAARLCRDRASYAADVGRWLEHRPDARTARTRHRPRPPLVPAARSRQPGPGGMRRRPAAPDDRRVPAALAPGRWQRMDAVPGHPAPLHPATRTWPLYWRDRHLRFHLYDELGPSPGIGGLLREIDRGPIAIFWG